MKVISKFSDRLRRRLVPVLLIVLSLSAADAAPVLPHKIVFLGDSLAAGLGARMAVVAGAVVLDLEPLWRESPRQLRLDGV